MGKPWAIKIGSWWLVLLVLNVLLAPAYLGTAPVTAAQVSSAPGQDRDEPQEQVAERSPVNAITNPGLHLDVAKAWFLPPTTLGVCLRVVPIKLLLPTRFALLPLVYFQRLFHHRISANAP
ncbi:MAG: hypothetical protein MUC97_07300 [Bernardetiaceae bacterium]|nr:hypothetical protein [Bernardetiaceae bacterium]